MHSLALRQLPHFLLSVKRTSYVSRLVDSDSLPIGKISAIFLAYVATVPFDVLKRKHQTSPEAIDSYSTFKVKEFMLTKFEKDGTKAVRTLFYNKHSIFGVALLFFGDVRLLHFGQVLEFIPFQT